MSSSEQRSSSAVRNLRSLFENKQESDDQKAVDTRGRSPIGRLGSNRDSSGGPLSRVRSSFVSVDPSGQMAAPIPNDMPALGRESSLQSRRLSFTQNEANEGAIAELKRELSNEEERRRSNPNIAEAIPENVLESAAGTPAIEPREDEAMGYLTHAASKLSTVESASPTAENEPPANPDKPTTGAEEQDGGMKAAEPTNEEAVSGGAALPPVQEDLRKTNATNEAESGQTNGTPKATKPTTNGASSTTKAPQSNGKPAAISTKAASKAPASSSVKSPINLTKSPSAAKSPLSPKAAPARDITRKASRTSLAAPTASSVARATSSEKRESLSSKASPPSVKPRPREATKSAEVSSRLLAPTAASRARHEVEAANTSKPPSTARPKPQTSSARPTPRSSLAARPESRTSHTSRRPAAPQDGSFLDRMTRPTAASSSRVHEKVEVKSPPRRTAVAPVKKAVAPKANGVAKPLPKAGNSAKVPASKIAEKTIEHAAADQAEATPAPQVNGAVDEANQAAEEAKNDLPAQEAGIETPVPTESGKLDESALESTPAFAEEGIR